MGTPVNYRPRNDTIDWLRGLVMVLMALDHTRDFVGDMTVGATDLAKTNPLLFFTRVVTHLCAPTFVFLTGVGAYLMRGRGRTTGQLSVFLFTRGVWMVFLEVTYCKTCWELYRPDYKGVGFAVFAAIGVGMIALSALVWLPRWAVGAIGLAVVCGHNAFDPVKPDDLGMWSGVWKLLHGGGPVRVTDGFEMWPAYPFAPWAGVMATGYALGGLFTLDRPIRRKVLAGIGLGCLAAFAVLRGGNVYGDPKPWPPQDNPLWALMAVLNCEKYPPSLAYVLVTLGVSFLLAAAVDREAGPPGRWVVTFGRVPLFFYLLHLPVIHLFAFGLLFAGLNLGWYPSVADVMRNPFEGGGLRLPLGGVYLTWVGVLLVLYPACRWFAGVKRRNKSAWLSYL